MKGHGGLVVAVVFGMLATSPSLAQSAKPAVVENLASTPATVVEQATTSTSPKRFGLTLPTPYVRGKVPVVFIHGLWMNSSCWKSMMVKLRADPTLDDRFQFWTFDYATGDPIPFAASLFRQSLSEARRTYDPDRTDAAFDQMILVGHSMGGLVAKMMVVDSGDQIWQVICQRPLNELKGDPNDITSLTQAVVFTARPEVRRVVFIATPHGGSCVDSGSMHTLGNRLVRISEFPLGMHRRLVSRNDPDFFSRYFAAGLPTSVQELRVNGPFLTKLHDLPLAPNVEMHSIIAIRPKSPADAPTDGLVTVDSARIAGVVSEKVVSSHHILCLENSEVMGEVRRIIQEHQSAP